MFFKANQEHKIGFKKLSDADLGLGISHQTHIGLFEGVLSFLANQNVVKSAMLIYNDYCDILDCFFDRIKNPEGSFRSPKIRIGENGSEDSVVAKIRSFVKNEPNKDWFLIWLGLNSDELVFVLFNNKNEEYNILKPHFHENRDVVDETSSSFNFIVNYIENKVDKVSHDLQKDLEIVSQIGVSRRLYKPMDIEKAETIFKKTGKEGEDLINEYLEKEKYNKKITCYEWMNKCSESGLPYDFIIDNNLSTEKYIDVKSTLYDFGQQVIFSNQELNFISSSPPNKYEVFRVYDLLNADQKLRICSKFEEYANSLSSSTMNFINIIKGTHTDVRTVKFAVSLNEKLFNVQSQIVL